jgi:hypothetical protein
MTLRERANLSSVIARESDDPVFQRRLRRNRNAAVHWIVRSSRTMTDDEQSDETHLSFLAAA